MSESTYVYVAWFLNTNEPVDSEDREWVASIAISAHSPGGALAWGDHLARRFMDDSKDTERLIRSQISRDSALRASIDDLPLVAEGYEASDEEIGW